MSRQLPEVMHTVADLATAWRCSKNYIYDLIASGALRSVNLASGRAKTRIPESAVAEFVAAHTRNPKEKAA